MSALPVAVFRAAQVRAMDRYAIEQSGIAGYTLMTRAAEASLALLRRCWPGARRVCVVCGAGNNGGDGYVLARLARSAGLETRLLAVADPARLAGEAARAYRDFTACGGTVEEFGPAALDAAELIVDALLGTGIDRRVEGAYAACIAAINSAGRPVFSLDIPSGLHADSGVAMGLAVQATRTLTFVALKTGLYLGAGPDRVGVLEFDNLGVPASASAREAPVLARLTDDDLRAALPSRHRAAHKGEHGRVLVVGGGAGMPGAVRLAAEAALRAGAGLVSVATRPEHAAAVVAGRPEVMAHGVSAPPEARSLMSEADVIAVGPGLGQSEWAKGLLEAALASGKPLVVDADALNLIALAPWQSDHWVLTPHPGEAARLLGIESGAVQADRLEAARQIARRFGGTVVLKGAATLIAGHDSVVRVCDRGNPGMATAGMGDILTGVIAGIAAQCRDLPAAAAAATLAHAEAGDRAARAGQRGLLATDLLAELRACVNPS